MAWDTIYIMRHEVLLTVLILFQLIADLTESKDKTRLINITIVTFIFALAAWFVPSESATLFGSMYIADPLRVLLKNILGISTLIVLLQSTTWLRKPENQSKSGPFFISILSTLMGM